MGKKPAPNGGGKGAKPKRARPTEKEIARRVPSTVAATLHALLNGVGSKKAVQAYTKVEGAPAAMPTEVENHLRRLKTQDPPDGEPGRGSVAPPAAHNNVPNA